MHLGKVSREMETLRMNQKDILKSKNTMIEVKNDIDGLIRLIVAEEKSVQIPILPCLIFGST